MKALESLELLHDATELRKLIIENPDMPLMIFVGQDTYNDEYMYTACTSVKAKIGEVQSQEQFPFDDIPISDLTIPIPRPTTPELKWGFLKETLKVLIQEERSQAQKEAYQKILKIMDGFDGVA